MATKDFELTVRITHDGEHIDTEYCTVTVDASVTDDDYEKLFKALREQYPEVYDDHLDCDL
jgi:16S rRNA U516 pseudouridylate synthase RsuA-like enzyme